MRQTQRNFVDHKTLESYALWMDEADNFHLINDKGDKIKRFYICPFDAVKIKLNTSNIISLSPGEFYSLNKDEVVTHKKFAGFKQFSKL